MIDRPPDGWPQPVGLPSQLSQPAARGRPEAHPPAGSSGRLSAARLGGLAGSGEGAAPQRPQRTGARPELAPAPALAGGEWRGRLVRDSAGQLLGAPCPVWIQRNAVECGRVQRGETCPIEPWLDDKNTSSASTGLEPCRAACRRGPCATCGAAPRRQPGGMPRTCHGRVLDTEPRGGAAASSEPPLSSICVKAQR